MAQKLTDDILKWTLEIDGNPAQKALGQWEQRTRATEAANKSLKTEMAKLEAQGKKNSKEWNDLDKKVKENNKTIRHGKEQMANYRKEIGLTALTPRQLVSRLKELRNQLKNTVPETDEWKRYRSEIKATQKRLDQVNISQKKTNTLFGALKKIAPYAGLGAAIGLLNRFRGQIFETRKEYQKYEAVLGNALQSEKEAQESLRVLDKLAAQTPYSLSELTAGYVKLTNYGLRPSREEMIKYGDVAASVGKSFDQYVEAIADATQFEFERLKEFGIRAKKDGDQIAFTFRGVTTEVKANSESVKDYLASLGEFTGVAGSMETISKTLEGQSSNFRDNVDRLANAIGKRLTPAFSSSLGIMSNWVQKLASYVDVGADVQIRKEQTELNLLVNALSSANDDTDLRSRLIQEIQDKYGDYIGNIDLEKAGYEELKTLLQDVNAEFEKRIRLAVLDEELLANQQKSVKLDRERYQLQKVTGDVVTRYLGEQAEGVTEEEKLNLLMQKRAEIVEQMSENGWGGNYAELNQAQYELQQAINAQTAIIIKSKEINTLQEEYNTLLKDQSEIKIAAQVESGSREIFKNIGSDSAKEWLEAFIKEAQDQDIENLINNKIVTREERIKNIEVPDFNEEEEEPDDEYLINKFLNSKEGEIAMLESLRENDVISELEYQDRLTAIHQKAYEERKQLSDQEKGLLLDRVRAYQTSFSAIVSLFGEETAIGKAALVAKQAMAAAEIGIELGLFQTKSKLQQAEAIGDIAKGQAKTAAAAPFPFNIPLIIGFLAQVAGIIATIKSSRNAAKKVKQRRSGNLMDVIGEEDGKLYENVPLKKTLNTGLIKSPTLVAEEPEIVVDTRRTDKIRRMNPAILQAIIQPEKYVVRQRANGNLPDETADPYRRATARLNEIPAQPAYDPELKQTLNNLTQALDNMQRNGLAAYIDLYGEKGFKEGIDKVNNFNNLIGE